MGREAYLARLALGISAFKEPLRDEDGDFILGGHARRYDNIDYVQQWDERGRPRNLATTQNAKRFYRSQNEILQACGLVVRKNAAKQRHRKGDEITESDRLEVLREENETGFILRFIDSLAADPLTWWVVNLRKRLLVFNPPRSTMLDIFRAGISSPSPMSFLFGGFAASTIDSFIVAASYSDSEDMRHIDFLETRSHESDTSWEKRLKTWGKWVLLSCIDMPLGMISTLQNLGFTVGPAVMSYLRSIRIDSTGSVSVRLDMPALDGIIGLFLIYTVRARIYEEVFWRLYVILRQVLPRPRNPSKLSIQAAETDEYDESESIVGVGRSLGTYTDRRYYGPQSLWPALQVAFPWLRVLNKKRIDRDKIKQETLTRCSMMEDDQDHHDSQSRRNMARRTENILSNLESLDIDVEEDFFVDVDQWSREIDGARERRAWNASRQIHTESTNHEDSNQQPTHTGEDPNIQYRRPATPLRIENPQNMVENADGSVTVDFDIPDHIRSQWNEEVRTGHVEVLSFPTSPEHDGITTVENPALQSTTNLLQIMQEIDEIAGQTTFTGDSAELAIEARGSALNAAPSEFDHQSTPATTSEVGRPLTPEPGIRRATSLSHTQTTPRPVRRITETGDDDVEEYLAEVLAGARRMEVKKKSKDRRESRITRVSVFASDSLAWHASTMLTSLVLLPVNAFYYRKLTRWFLGMTEGLPVTLSIFPREETQLVESGFGWVQGRMLLLSVGIECLMHGLVWSIGCGAARYYGRRYHWGQF